MIHKASYVIQIDFLITALIPMLILAALSTSSIWLGFKEIHPPLSKTLYFYDSCTCQRPGEREKREERRNKERERKNRDSGGRNRSRKEIARKYEKSREERGALGAEHYLD